VPVADLQALNPSLLRMTTPKNREFELHVPAGTKEKYLASVAAIPTDMRVWWRYHKVEQGETLASISRSYRTTVKAISSANNLESSELDPDTKLIIPIAVGKHAMSEDTGTYSRRATAYRIRRGDTVASVADQFGVPPQMVRRWNRIKGDSLRGRRVVYVHLPISPSASETRRVASSSRSRKSATKTKASARAEVVRHKVKTGETLSSIASSYKTTISALERDNGKLANLRPGMILVVKDSR
jgi:membrane-bound lytic murein transglycosylase D